MEKTYILPFLDYSFTVSELDIEFFGFIVNVILAGVAIYVLFLTKKQTKVAKDALETTIKNNDYIGRTQEQALINNNRQIEERNRIENERIELENTPFLQIEDFKLNYSGTIIEGFSYNLHNLGKYPTKIIEDRSNIILELDYTSGLPLYNAEKHLIGLHQRKIRKVGQYVTFNNPIKVNESYYNIETDSSKFSPPMQEHPMIYVSGEIFYKNLYNNKDMLYSYVIFLYYLESKRLRFFLNENTEILNPNIPN